MNITLRRFAALWGLVLPILTIAQATLHIPGGTAGIGNNTVNSNVGIGTAAPNQKLSIDGNLSLGTTGSFILMGQSAFTGGGGYIFLKSTGDAGRDFNVQNYSSANGWQTNVFVAGESGNVGIGTATPTTKLDVNGELHVGGVFRIGELYYSPLQTIGLAVGTERWIKLATVPNNHYVRFQLRAGSSNSEEIAEIKIFGTYYNAQTGITIERQTYNEHLREVRVTGSDGHPRTIYIKIRASNYAPSVVWRAMDSKGAVSIHNVEESPVGGFGHVVAGNLVTSTNTNITTTGSVGIGTTSLTHKLAVNGTIRAKEIIVDSGWADYVFADDYRLAPLPEVEAHIREKKHLPGIPSAARLGEEGLSVGEMQTLMMSKIEELTLHAIAQQKLIEAQQVEIQALKVDRGSFVNAPKPSDLETKRAGR